MVSHIVGGGFGVIALGVTLNAIDLKRYNVLSMILYIALGWCIIFTGPTAIKALGEVGMNWMLAGGISYTVGAVFYGVAEHGKKPHRYIHSVFHLFVVLGSILQYMGIILYII